MSSGLRLADSLLTLLWPLPSTCLPTCGASDSPLCPIALSECSERPWALCLGLGLQGPGNTGLAGALGPTLSRSGQSTHCRASGRGMPPRRRGHWKPLSARHPTCDQEVKAGLPPTPSPCSPASASTPFARPSSQSRPQPPRWPSVPFSPNLPTYPGPGPSPILQSSTAATSGRGLPGPWAGLCPTHTSHLPSPSPDPGSYLCSFLDPIANICGTQGSCQNINLSESPSLQDKIILK